MTSLKELVTEYPVATGIIGLTAFGILGFVTYRIINYFENRQYKKDVEAGIQHIMEDQRNRR